MDATEEDIPPQKRRHLVVFVPLLPTSFDFCLLPSSKDPQAHSDTVEKHRYLVYHGLCEVFFDLALYPCVLDIAITGRGFTFTKKQRVDGPAVALDVWEEMHDEMKERCASTFRGCLWRCRASIAPGRAVTLPCQDWRVMKR